MASYPKDTNPGQFIGTTQIYDLGKDGVNSKDFSVRLRQNFNNLILSLNSKDTGYYAQEEFINGQLFYPDYSAVNSHTSAPSTYRQVYRKVIDTGALLDTAAKTIAHNITFLPDPGIGDTTFVFTRIYGCATDPANRIALPLPYVSAAGGSEIELSVNATDIVITTASNRTAFTKSHVVVEYVKE